MLRLAQGLLAHPHSHGTSGAAPAALPATHVCWLLQSMPVGTHDRPQRRWVIDDWSLRIDHECFLPPDSTHLGRLQTPSASGAGCSCNQVLDPRTIPEYIFLGLAVLATTGLHLAHEPRVHRLLVIAQWELPALSGL